MPGPMSGPPISPDGNYWWDGQAWRPMPAPAVQSPVQAPAPADQPAWLDQPAAAAAPEPAPNLIPEPALAQEPVVLPWSESAPRRSSRTWIYVTGAALIAVMALTALYVGSQMRAYSQNTAAVVSPSPSPIISDYEKANRFLNVDLTPPMGEVYVALPPAQKTCTVKLPPSCKDALIALNKAMLDVDDAFAKNQADIPVCIGRPVQQFQFDLRGMEQGVSQAIAGFNANSRSLIVSGLIKYNEIVKYVKPDVDRINKALASCSKTV